MSVRVTFSTSAVHAQRICPNSVGTGCKIFSVTQGFGLGNLRFPVVDIIEVILLIRSESDFSAIHCANHSRPLKHLQHVLG